MNTVTEKPSLRERVRQFNALELPGQPMATHMGTSYLVNDLWDANKEMLAVLKQLHAILDFEEPIGAAALFDDDAEINAVMTRGLAAIRKAEGVSE